VRSLRLRCISHRGNGGNGVPSGFESQKTAEDVVVGNPHDRSHHRVDAPRRLRMDQAVASSARGRDREGRSSSPVTLPTSNPSFRQVAQIDASYVLDWLRQTDAPPDILALQERVCEALGGFVSFPERASQT
jgi:hypothetical protein